LVCPVFPDLLPEHGIGDSDEVAVLEAQDGEIRAWLRSGPPISRPLPAPWVGEVVVVDRGPQVTGWGLREGIGGQERENGRRTLEERLAECEKPGLRARVVESGEPHLPIEPWLVRGNEGRSSIQGPWFVAKL